MKRLAAFILLAGLSFQIAAATKPQARAFLKSARHSLLAGDLNSARANYEKALRVDPRSSQAARGLGQVAALDGRPADAIVSYRMCLKLNPREKLCRKALAKLVAPAKKR